MRRSKFSGCVVIGALAAISGVSGCSSTASSVAGGVESHVPSAVQSHLPGESGSAKPSQPASATGSIKGIPIYEPSTVHHRTDNSATMSSPESVTKVSDYYVSVVDKNGWTTISKTISSHGGNLTVKKSTEGATISVAPTGNGSLINISTYSI